MIEYMYTTKTINSSYLNHRVIHMVNSKDDYINYLIQNAEHMIDESSIKTNTYNTQKSQLQLTTNNYAKIISVTFIGFIFYMIFASR